MAGSIGSAKSKSNASSLPSTRPGDRCLAILRNWIKDRYFLTLSGGVVGGCLSQFCYLRRRGRINVPLFDEKRIYLVGRFRIDMDQSDARVSKDKVVMAYNTWMKVSPIRRIAPHIQMQPRTRKESVRWLRSMTNKGLGITMAHFG